mmetsp:Transcript_24298/g.61593  ORF Transcript_24298/g.61593 Transcript_24298/m.61593 type:complete len:301 (+) Transcript_24298:1327-2229(+)
MHREEPKQAEADGEVHRGAAAEARGAEQHGAEPLHEGREVREARSAARRRQVLLALEEQPVEPPAAAHPRRLDHEGPVNVGEPRPDLADARRDPLDDHDHLHACQGALRDGEAGREQHVHVGVADAGHPLLEVREDEHGIACEDGPDERDGHLWQEHHRRACHEEDGVHRHVRVRAPVAEAGEEGLLDRAGGEPVPEVGGPVEVAVQRALAREAEGLEEVVPDRTLQEGLQAVLDVAHLGGPTRRPDEEAKDAVVQEPRREVEGVHRGRHAAAVEGHILGGHVQPLHKGELLPHVGGRGR